MRTRSHEQILEQRCRLMEEYGTLYDAIASVLFRADPIGIAVDNENLDEYEPEASTILPRLRTCKSAHDVLCAVQEEFVRWFGADNAGPRESYTKIADEIWALWKSRT